MTTYGFVLAIIFIVVGIPTLSRTLITIIHGPKAERKRKRDELNQKESEMLEEIYYGLSDLGKRVKNLETILESKENSDE